MYSRNITIKKKLKKRTSCVIKFIKLPIDLLFKYFKRLHQRVFLFCFYNIFMVEKIDVIKHSFRFLNYIIYNNTVFN